MTIAQKSPTRRSLPARELLVLQLLARGYSFPQISALIGVQLDHAADIANSAATHFGVHDWRAAMALAQRLNLISC